MTEYTNETLLDYVLGELEPKVVRKIENQMIFDEVLCEKIETLKSSLELTQGIDQIHIPDPSALMDKKFYQMLEKETQASKNNWNISHWFSSIFKAKQIKSFAYACSLVAVGIYVGHLYTYKQINLNQIPVIANNAINEDNNKVYELAVKSMLQMPSANMRLQAVSIIDNKTNVEDTVVLALLHTLNNDTNTNVRLSVLSVLAKFSNTPIVREGLVKSILVQDSPIIQMEIAKLMVSLQETKAIEPLKELLNSNQLINPVRKTINQTLNELI